MTPDELDHLQYDWAFWARPEQTAPAWDWHTWLYLAGRGAGKTRTAAEWVRDNVCGPTPLAAGKYSRVALVGETAADCRDVLVQGESGLLAVHPKDFRPAYQPSLRRVTWPNGAMATLYNATEPDQLRGPQHDAAWCFIAGTMIATPGGEVPVQTLRVGDLVLTRKGARRITAVAARSAEVGRVSFVDGRELVGTAEHPVLTSHGWTMLSNLAKGDTVCAMPVWSGAEKYGTVTVAATTSAQIRSAIRRLCASIAKCGARLTASLRQAWKCTTGMMTRGTMSLPTLNCSPNPSIAATTRRKSQFQGVTRQRFRTSFAHVLGAESVSCGRSIQNVLPVAFRANERRLTTTGNHYENASIVEEYSLVGTETIALRVVSIWERDGRDSVYNLTVEDCHEYFANGILVHNCDEQAKWRYAQETWDMLQFGLRLGDNPRQVITTTPRPIPILRELLRREGDDVAVTRGSTYANAANLADKFVDQLKKRYEGTRLGRQELNAEILDDIPGSLWSRAKIDETRRKIGDKLPDMQRIVVAIDPAAKSNATPEDGAETGIVAAGVGVDGRGYVMEDGSCRLSPVGWARRAIALYDRYSADAIVVEVNQGGDMVKAVLSAERPSIPVIEVHASRGKVTRAEPIAALYEQGRVSHIGAHAALEDQMVLFTANGIEGGTTGDRVDALVWAFTELFPSIVNKTSVKWEDAFASHGFNQQSGWLRG